MFDFLKFPRKFEIDPVNKITDQFGTKCFTLTQFGDHCIHDQRQHRSIARVDTIEKYYYECMACDCKGYTPPSPMQLAELIEHEYEVREERDGKPRTAGE